jgi:hypothetical protein
MHEEKPKFIGAEMFADPNLDDRELVRLLLFKMTKLEGEVATIREFLLRGQGEDANRAMCELFKRHQRIAFSTWEHDVHQFVASKQNPEGN